MRKPMVLLSAAMCSTHAAMPKPRGYRRLRKELVAMFAEGHERERQHAAAAPKVTHNAREKALQWLEEKETGYKWKPEPSVE